MKNAHDFLAWFQKVAGISPEATASETQQAILDAKPVTQSETADNTEGVVSTPSQSELVAELDKANKATAQLTAELIAKSAALVAAQSEIEKLSREPAATHTNGADDIDDNKASNRGNTNPEMLELGNILKAAMNGRR